MALPSDVELVETLGEGSFGTVYVARLKDGAIERTVVLKVLKASWADNEDILHRSRDEAALLSRLNHDSIVRVEQLSTLQGRPAVVMEFVRGLTLDRIVKENGALPVGAALQVVARIAGALDAAYNKVPPGMEAPLRVVHRDIKPSNIILSVNGGVKVLDFGTARGEFGAREAETMNVTLGSPRYMAPERFDGLDSGPAVDVYALGVTFYEIVAGRPMGRLSVNPDRHHQQISAKIDALREAHGAGGGEQLETLLSIFVDSMQYDPTKRPSSQEFRTRCLDLLGHLPGVSITLDRFCESIVEPLYEDRDRRPPIPLDEPGIVVESGSFSQSSASLRSPSASSSSIIRASTSSLLMAVGGGRWAMSLAVLGMITAVGGMVFLKKSMSENKAVVETVSVLKEMPAEAEPVAVPEEKPAPADVAPDLAEPAEPAEPAEAAKSAVAPEASQPPVTPAAVTPTPDTAPKGGGVQPTQTSSKNTAAQPPPKRKAAPPRRATPVKKAAPAPEPEPEVLEPAPPPPPEFVSFSVVSAPAGATISMGGKRFVTPDNRAKLPPGEYTAKVTFLSGVSRTCRGIEPQEGKRLVFRESGGGCP
ncbi:MAG: serine/threonine-protein kinase [Myxococcota bacterium]|nr:serine/threonine-protein kinase [Myxococcota bacterium]